MEIDASRIPEPVPHPRGETAAGATRFWMKLMQQLSRAHQIPECGTPEIVDVFEQTLQPIYHTMHSSWRSWSLNDMPKPPR